MFVRALQQGEWKHQAKSSCFPDLHFMLKYPWEDTNVEEETQWAFLRNEQRKLQPIVKQPARPVRQSQWWIGTANVSSYPAAWCLKRASNFINRYYGTTLLSPLKLPQSGMEFSIRANSSSSSCPPGCNRSPGGKLKTDNHSRPPGGAKWKTVKHTTTTTIKKTI